MGTKDGRDGLGRRQALGLLLGSAGAVASGALLTGAAKPQPRKSASRMPALFLAHGAPLTLDDPAWMGELRNWAVNLPRPRAVLMLSAHWEERPLTVGATRTVPLVYDFYGFPERYYRVQYPAPGAPELAARVKQLAGQPVAEAPERGLDHGAFVPLMGMYPGADVPVLQASLPSLEPRELFALGRALAPLRDEGVLIVGSGFMTHNLRLLRQVAAQPDAAPPAWASEFDAWNAERLAKRDVDALLDYRRKAPGVELALPTHEHYVPLLVALGAASEGGPVDFPITGFMMGIFTRRSVQFG